MNQTETEQQSNTIEVKAPAKSKRTRAATPAPTTGAPPEAAVAWKLRRYEAGEWHSCEVPNVENGVTVHADRFPLSNLSVATIDEQWGGGVYRVVWLMNTGKACGQGPEFTLDGPPKPLYRPPPSEVPQQSSALVAPPPAPPAFGLALPPPGDPWAQMAFMHALYQQDRERERERDREQHERDRSREREFYTAMLQATRPQPQDRASREEIARLAARIEELEEEDEVEEIPPQSALATVPRNEIVAVFEALVPVAREMGVLEIIRQKIQENAPAVGKIVEGIIKAKGAA